MPSLSRLSVDRYLVSPWPDRHFHHLCPQNHYRRLLSKRHESLLRSARVRPMIRPTLRTKPLVSGRWSWGCSSSLCRYSSSSSLSIDGDSKCWGRLVKSKASGSCLIVYIVRLIEGEEVTRFRCECLRSMNDVRDRCSQSTPTKENEEKRETIGQNSNWPMTRIGHGEGGRAREKREESRTVIDRTSITSWLDLPNLFGCWLTEICKHSWWEERRKQRLLSFVREIESIFAVEKEETEENKHKTLVVVQRRMLTTRASRLRCVTISI